MLFVDWNRNASAIIKPIISVEGVITNEIVSCAVEAVVTALGNEVHDAAASVTEFRLEAIGVHGEFRDCFERRGVGGNPALGQGAGGVGRHAIEVSAVAGCLTAAEHEAVVSAEVLGFGG